MIKTRILIISNDDNLSKVISDVLGEAYNVQKIQFCKENIDEVFKIEKNKFSEINLIILNLSSITFDISNLLSKFNSNFNFIPLIVMHHYNQKIFADAFIEWGAKGYLPINFQSNELKTAVKEVLSNKLYISKKLL